MAEAYLPVAISYLSSTAALFAVRPDRIGRRHGTASAGGVVIEPGDDHATR